MGLYLAGYLLSYMQAYVLAGVVQRTMFRLRADVFHGRLGWDVRVEGGREHDWFDLIGPHYLVARAAGDTALQVGTGLSDRYGSSLDGGPVIALSRGLAGLTP